jgi:signal transduction histidine kinase
MAIKEKRSRPRRTGSSERQQFFTAPSDVPGGQPPEAEREAVAREHAALASRMISAQDEERQRIARDLHDNVGQQVTALRLLLDLVIVAAKDDGVRQRVTHARSIVEELDKQLDFLTGQLRPVVLDLGAISAIRQFVDEWASTFSIEAEFECRGVEDLRLNPDVETHLYRVVQEALNNVAKHAQAKHVSVQLARQDQTVVLMISDDGSGFDAAGRKNARGPERATHLGLVGMRERAQLINGTIEIRSAPSLGTTVTLRVPATSQLAQAG